MLHEVINIDIDFLFTTYEATNNDKTKGNILHKILERLKELIKKLREDIIPKLLNMIKKKKEEKPETKLLPSPKENEHQTDSKTDDKKETEEINTISVREDIYLRLVEIKENTINVKDKIKEYLSYCNKLSKFSNDEIITLGDNVYNYVKDKFFKEIKKSDKYIEVPLGFYLSLGKTINILDRCLDDIDVARDNIESHTNPEEGNREYDIKAINYSRTLTNLTMSISNALGYLKGNL